MKKLSKIAKDNIIISATVAAILCVIIAWVMVRYVFQSDDWPKMTDGERAHYEKAKIDWEVEQKRLKEIE